MIAFRLRRLRCLSHFSMLKFITKNLDLMKKANFTLKSVLKRRWSMGLTSLFFVLLGYSSVHAQCTLICVGSYNVGFDDTVEDCVIMLMAADLVHNVSNTCTTPVEDLQVHILDKHGKLLNTEGKVYYDQIGTPLKYSIYDATSGNSCWGWLNLEDKTAPTLECPDEMFVRCYDDIDDMVREGLDPDDCDYDNITLQLLNETILNNNCNRGWTTDILFRIIRVYRAIDSHGNASPPCTLTIWVQTIEDLEDINFPPNYLKIDGDALKCDAGFPLDKYGNPSPLDQNGNEGTGVPYIQINGKIIPLYPNDKDFCNLIVDYKDDVVKNDCVTKIMRLWTVIEWSCRSPQRTRTWLQVIEIVDDNAPNIHTPNDFTATTSPHGCYANVFFPAPVVSDPCNSPVTTTLTVEGEIPSFVNPFNGGFVKLGVGENLLIITARDKCGNARMDTTTVTVVDKTPPVAVCKTYTTVSISVDGVAKVPAHVFDNGSHDECKLNGMMVRRMDGGGECEIPGKEFDPTVFNDFVLFCCSDIGKEVMVIFRVYDKAGNFNDCMVIVEVQDKIPPSLVCPPHLYISCLYDFADYNEFGTVRNKQSEIKPIKAPFKPVGGGGVLDFGGNINQYTDGFATDNCDVDISQRIEGELDQCGLGTLKRWFIATDPAGNKDSCFQYLHFVLEDPVSKEDIEFPEDVEIEGCFDPEGPDFGPDVLGYPILPEHACALLGVSYKDEVFPFNNTNGDACFKILRNWKVIDWCQKESVNGHHNSVAFKTFSKQQVIKVFNKVAPTILGDFDRIEVCFIEPVCAFGEINLSATATDDCTQTLRATYRIDLDNNGTYDETHTTMSNTIEVMGVYPAGSHRILFTFEDFCGNRTSVEQLFDIVNCKPPTPVCYDGLAVDLMEVEDGGMVELWASDFDAKSFHVCGYDVIISFSPDTSDKVKIFTCDDVGLNDVPIYASIVTPGGQIFQDFCIARLDVQDNMEVCPVGPGAPRVIVRGVIATEDERRVENVKVSLMGSEMPDALTGDMGTYAFPEMPVGGKYQVMPQKKEEHLNGVSTLDLVLIQRHVLGISSLDTPYKLIAADINNDKVISSTDIIELRKNILGIYKEFRSNSSWRFVDKEFQFETLQDALQGGLPEMYSIDNLQSSMDVNFIGIKIGDVSGDVHANRRDRDNSRSHQSIALKTSSLPYQAGDRLSLPFAMNELEEVAGFQVALYIHSSLDILGIEAKDMPWTSENYHFDEETRILTISWNDPQGRILRTSNSSFVLNLLARTSGHTRSDIRIDQQILNAEVYDGQHQIYALSLIAEEELAGIFQVYQNTPNPFNTETEIRFVLPEDLHVVLTVFDVTGRRVHQQRGDYNSGLNTIRLNKSDMHSSGVLYYQIEAGSYSATKKMVVIQ